MIVDLDQNRQLEIENNQTRVLVDGKPIAPWHQFAAADSEIIEIEAVSFNQVKFHYKITRMASIHPDGSITFD